MMSDPSSLRVLVLGGGPDSERSVSLKSAAAVAAALRQAGHTVIESDILPDDLAALDIPCDVVFPVLHGAFGEGGDLQRLLEMQRLPFVGSDAKASVIAMDKMASKQRVAQHGVPTPEYQILTGPEDRLELAAPLVLKPLREGSSYGVEICPTADRVATVRPQLHARYGTLLAERFVTGREITVGIIDGQALPPIQIIPRQAFYDFAAKYDRDDTRYEFDIDLPPATLEEAKRQALAAHRAIGCRHLSRVDFIVDGEHRPWFLEINTLPGFTDHSLVPKAAARAGMDMPSLCDRLVRLALSDPNDR